MPHKPGNLSLSPQKPHKVEGQKQLHRSPYTTHMPTPLIVPSLSSALLCVCVWGGDYTCIHVHASVCLRAGTCAYIHRDQSLTSGVLTPCPEKKASARPSPDPPPQPATSASPPRSHSERHRALSVWQPHRLAKVFSMHG